MSNFKVREKVVCVEPILNLKKNEIYTVNYVSLCSCGCCLISVAEDNSIKNIRGTRCDCGEAIIGYSLWYPYRFRKLDNKFSEDLIAEIIKQVKEEELILTN